MVPFYAARRASSRTANVDGYIQAVKEQPGVHRRATLGEQRADPFFRLPQRRRKQRESVFDRCTCHTMTSESWYPIDSEFQSGRKEKITTEMLGSRLNQVHQMASETSMTVA